MLTTLARSWWTLTLRGVVAILFGLMALALPGITLATLVVFFGAYAIVNGVFALIAAVQRRGPVWPLILEGVAGIGAGIVTFLWPGITTFVLLYLIAGWAIATGVFEIIAAVRLRKEISGEILLALTGILSIAFGVLVMVWPGAGALTVVWMIGSYAIIFGGLLIALSLRVRSLRERPRSVPGVPGIPEVPGGRGVGA